MKFVRNTYASQSGTTSFNGPAILCDQLFALSAQIIAGGTLVGSLKLQGSNDAPVNVPGGAAPTATNWSDISGASVSVSSAGVFLIPKTEICYQYIRLVWTRDSGSGNVVINTMQLGI